MRSLVLWLCACCLNSGRAAAGAPAPCVGLSTAQYDGSAKFRAVHIDTLDPRLEGVFEEARRGWLTELALHHTTDGRGFFFQRAGSTFLTLRSFTSFSEYDALRAFRASVGERIGPEGEKAGEAYDRGDVALLSPHNSEVWSRLEDLDYRAPGTRLTEYTAGYLQMVVEQVTSEQYQVAWRQIQTALSSAQYPIGRVTFFSSLGSGKQVSFWLATSRDAFQKAGSPEQAVARSLGAEKATALFASLRAACSDVTVEEVVPRRELSSPD